MTHRIADLFQSKVRFLRSTHLERDVTDQSALQGYILTEQHHQHLLRMAEGLTTSSKQRAWRITGDYGSGKSSFGLMIAHLFARNDAMLPASLQEVLHWDAAKIPALLPVLVTGAREPLRQALLRSLYAAVCDEVGDGSDTLRSRIQATLDRPTHSSDGDQVVLDLLTEAMKYIQRSTSKWQGIFVILDELGKFLEYAALHPERQDIYLLQKLAEIAARSDQAPLIVVGMLHQGFHAYADQLSQPAQKEWEKVAGRYEEIVFHQPLEEALRLITEALGVTTEALPIQIIKQSQEDLQKTIALGWYGMAASGPQLAEYAPKLYPLHPTVLPVLVQLFRRFGQNERSLFSFLFSSEPLGLREFAEQPLATGQFYRLHNLYDYARSTFGHRLGLQGYRSHWNYIEAVIENVPHDDSLAMQLLKTVGVLNLIDAHNLIASDAALVLACDNQTAEEKLHALRHERRLLYFRGAAGGYCLWPHTSVNLDQAYAAARHALGTPSKVADLVQTYLETRPLVARRHYIKTGNLRHFDVRYVSPNALAPTLPRQDTNADGLILIPLCETEEERQEALRDAQQIHDSTVLVAIPGKLNSLLELLQAVQRWEWVAQHTPELTHDPYAAEEVSRQITAATQRLDQRMQNVLGLRHFVGTSELQWFHEGQALGIATSRDLLTYLSDVCDQVYPDAPKILNELVNRRFLSSAAAAARMRLLEKMFARPLEAMLGMDPSKKPPEMSIYLSILKQGCIHREVDGAFTFAEPPADGDSCNLRPALAALRSILTAKPDGRIAVATIAQQLRQPPLGIRDGIMPILLAAFTLIHQQDIAYYEDGRFLREVDGFAFQRLIKAPETFEIQYCQMTSVRLELFGMLFTALGITSPQTVDLLALVRPLMQFAAQLPTYTHNTKKLSQKAIAVRAALRNAHEPATLLFQHLPEACGFAPFAVDESADEADMKQFVTALREAIVELRAAHPALQERMQEALSQHFELTGPLASVRRALAERADALLVAVNERRLKAFCLRLADRNLPDLEWIEALGSLLSERPPAKWMDADEDRYRQELGHLSGQFQRVRQLVFPSASAESLSTAVCITLTRASGKEKSHIIHIGEDEESAVQDIEIEIGKLLQKHGKIGIVGVSQALWQALAESEPPAQ